MNSSGLTPILLAPWGRNGSTYLMSVFAGTAEIVAPGEYPFERYQLLHLMRAAEALAGLGPAPPLPQSALMPGLWDGRAAPIDGLPFLAGDRGELAADLLSGLWDGWQRHLGAQGLIAPSARLYAEKSTVEVVEAFAKRRPVYCIFIKRDPRDLFASSKAFNEARGNFEFGWTEKVNVSELVRRGIGEMAHCLDVLDRLPPSVAKIVIRYEDLVLSQRRTFADLSERLGVRLEPEAAVSIPSGHRTAPDGKASIGRWRRELPPPMLEAILDVGRDVFARLGYD